LIWGDGSLGINKESLMNQLIFMFKNYQTTHQKGLDQVGDKKKRKELMLKLFEKIIILHEDEEDGITQFGNDSVVNLIDYLREFVFDQSSNIEIKSEIYQALFIFIFFSLI